MVGIIIPISLMRTLIYTMSHNSYKEEQEFEFNSIWLQTPDAVSPSFVQYHSCQLFRTQAITASSMPTFYLPHTVTQSKELYISHIQVLGASRSSEF